MFDFSPNLSHPDAVIEYDLIILYDSHLSAYFIKNDVYLNLGNFKLDSMGVKLMYYSLRNEDPYHRVCLQILIVKPVGLLAVVSRCCGKTFCGTKEAWFYLQIENSHHNLPIFCHSHYSFSFVYK